MTIKVGTIQEMTGVGYEIMVDVETRSLVLARFFDGQLLGASQEVAPDNLEPTLVSAT